MKNFQDEYRKYTDGEKKLDEIYHLIAMQTGISDSVLWILYCLADDSIQHTQNDIARRVGLPRQTINSAVSKLVKEGHVYLEKLPVARNNKQLILTEKGREFCKKYIAPIVEAEERAFNRLSDEEQEIYLSIGIRHNSFLAEELGGLLSDKKESCQERILK